MSADGAAKKPGTRTLTTPCDPNDSAAAPDAVPHPGPRLRDLPIYWRWFLRDPLGLALVLPWRWIRGLVLWEFVGLTYLLQAFDGLLMWRKWRWWASGVVIEPPAGSSGPAPVRHRSLLLNSRSWPLWLAVEPVGPCSGAVLLAIGADKGLVSATNITTPAPGVLGLNRPPSDFRLHMIGPDRPRAFRLRPLGRWDIYRRERRAGAGRDQALRRAWPSPERRLTAIELDDYNHWIRDHETCAGPPAPAGGAPKFSILMVVDHPNGEYLGRALQSVLAQDYAAWELRLIDDTDGPSAVKRLPARLLDNDRIRAARLVHPLGFAKAMNFALEAATGDVVLMMEQDAQLAPHALSAFAEAFSDPRVQVAYADEDVIDASGRRSQPELKPTFDAERLLAQNYLGHPLAARTRLALDAGGLDPALPGAQHHDLLLRMIERAPREAIVHIPRILYHRRDYAGRREPSLEGPKIAERSRRAAARQHLARLGHEVEVSSGARGCNRVHWPLPDPAPSVCVVVPSKDRPDLLAASAYGILDATAYPNLHLCVVDNGSVQPDTLALIDRLRGLPRVTVIAAPGPFNFSQLCNVAADLGLGDVLAFINDDTVVTEPDWLAEMVAQAVRPDVGAVGAKLLYPDGRIQHIGVTLGMGELGVAGHEFRGAAGNSIGLQDRIGVVREVSAVTGACLVVERRKFDAVGGFDLGLAVAFNDVDLCLRLNARGWRSIWTPYATLVHVESASRGPDSHGPAARRLETEVTFMKARWGEALAQDPYYHPMLAADESGELRKPGVDGVTRGQAQSFSPRGWPLA